MAELYDQEKIYANRPSANPQAPQSTDAELESLLAELPPEEREAARQRITAAPTGEDINRAMEEKNANGEVLNMSLDQYRLWKTHHKNKEVDVFDSMGQAAGGVYDEVMKAAGSIYDHPLDSIAKFTPSLVEAFTQGTRNLYGMAAQSADPDSVFFRMKHALSANGSDEVSEYRQFMEAQAFNVHSMRLATGKDTLVMDKDIINPEMTQVMSYIADPTLFVPFGGIAAKGAKLIGMGEALAKASARASVIQRKVLAGTLKWGVGAPIEFMGTAVRNTIDFGLEKAGSAFEVATGMPVAEARTTAQMYGWYTASAALEGRTVGLPIVGNIAGAMVGSTTARGIGEAISAVGEQMGKQAEKGRGVLSYAGQAIRDADKSGVPLSKHARALLNVLDKVDPLFVYSIDISKGAAEGMAIGAGLGYLSAGEEGAASGAGAGLALGSIGAGAGSLASDIGKTRLYDRIAVQRHLVIEALRKIDPDKASAFEAFAKTAELTGNRDLIAQVDGIITGIDVMAPNSKFVARSEVDHMAWLLSQRIDPNTGRLIEPLAMFSEFGTDRKSRAKALSFLSTLGNRFDGDSKKLIEYMKTLPEDHAMRRQFFRLDDKQKKAVFSAIDDANSAEAKKIFGNKKAYEFYSDLNYAEANVARVNAIFDAGNKTQANETIRQFLKDETGKDGKLSARGQLLKDKLATEGYFDKDGTMRPSRLKDVETTIGDYHNAKGFVFRRDSTGQVEIHINLDSFGKETAPHELFHAVMMDSIMKPDFIDRLGQKLLGKFDENGKRIENASVDINQVKKFFGRYIDALHGKNSEEANNQNERLKLAMEEYESRGSTKKISLETKDTLEGLLEEFGSYYFGAFVNDKPVDYLFRGGELGAMREIMGGAKQGFLDFWRSKIKGINPDFNFDPATNEFITQAFEKDGVRTKNKSLDLFMRDFVRATAMANRQGGFDITRLSPEARDTFVKNNGIRGLSLTRDANGNLVRSSQRKVIIEQMRVGKEIYKILAGLDPKFRQGLLTDGEGNLSGRLSPEAMEAMVQSGHIDRAWVDKIQQAYNILDGKGGNVIHFGYLGRTAQIGDYAWPRLVGSDVPFKNRAAVLLGVDFKVGKDGKMYSLFHTLDKAVIDGRADVLWSDPAVRTLWGGDRGAMEADFFRYLSNASKAAGDLSRLESAVLLEDGTGAGSRRRDVLHQMLGLVKAEGDVYLNKPIAEIPYGIRHSVTTFNVDGISGMRIGTERWNVVPENAFKDLSRNFQPSEMAREETPNGAIIKHPLGYKFAEKNGKVRSFDDQGNAIGVFDSIQQAAEEAGKHSVKQKQELIKSANEQTKEQVNQSRKFQVLERNERDEAVRLGDVFEVGKVKRFTENTNVIRQSRDEYVLDKAERELVAGSTAFYERLFRAGAEDLLKSFDINDRMKVAMDNFDAIKQKVEEASAMNDLAYRRGEKTAKQYTQDGVALLAEVKQAMKEKNLVEEQSKMILNQNTTTLTTFLDIGADGDWKQQIRNGEMPKLTDEGLEKLNDFVRKQIEAYRTNNVQGLPETISAHYSDEYNQQFKTGEAFTTIATHGTSSLDLMVAREFKREKLGTTFKIFSSQNAVFSGGQESTGRRYAGMSSSTGTPLELVISKHSPEFVSAKQDLNVYTGYLLDSLINSYFKDTFKPTYEQFKERFKFRTDEAARQAYEMSGNDFVVHDGKLVSKNRLNESLETIAGYKFESEEFKDLLFVVENYHGIKLQEIMKRGDGVKEQEMTNFLRRLIIRDANEKGTPPNTVYNTFGKYSPDATSLADSGGRGAARLISDAYYTLNTAMRTVGYSLDSIGVDPFSVTDPTSKYYEGVRNSVDANLNRIIAETKTVPMEVRTLVKMKNPLVIEGRKEYGEYFLKDIMEPAMKAGHDGVVFRNMRDGGKYDNIYCVFKDYMDANLMIIDTSFDDVKMPRGNDSEGKPVRYGRELGLRNQPTEGAGGFDFTPNSNKASNILQQYLYGLKTGKTHQEMMTPELDYVFNNIEQFTKASNDDIVQSILRLGDRGKTIVDRLQNKEITLKQAVEDAKNVDDYTYLRELKDIRDKRKGLYNAFMRATGQMRKISDNDGRRYNTEGERESRNTRYLQPTEGAEGGRVYDQNGKQWKFGFIGKQSEENPELTKGVSLQHISKENGVNKLVFTDTSSGESKNIGHISWDKFGGISTNIDPAYRGKGLSYLFYSEAAERMRAQGIKQSVSTIVNKDAIPVKIREAIFGDTRRFISRSEEGKPIGQTEAKAIIAAMQEQGGEYAGVNVSNKIDPNARYQPTEGNRTYTPEQMSGKFIGRYAEENAKSIKGLKPKFNIFGSGDQGNIELMKGEDSIGHINFSFSKATGEALIEYTRVADRQQGKGYGKLLYSELVERLRSMGMKEVQGMIVDERGRPQKIRERIIDKENARIGGDKTQIDYVERDQDSGDTHTGVTSYLYKNARYQPTEGFKPREEVVRRAKEAGYGTTVYYHGTNKDFTEFKSSPRNHSVGASEGRESGNVFFLSSDPLDAEHYKKAWVGDQNKNRVITAFVKLDNPYDVSSNAKHLPFTPEQEAILKKYLDKYSRHPDKEYQLLSLIGQQKRGNSPLFQLFERNERAAMLKEMGYDGIKDGRHISVFDSEQIKSADDFTYDDSGKEIPLEERFNKNKKDIRFQPTEGEQVSYKARYDTDEAIVGKLKEKFKGYRNLTAKDMLEFIVENKGQFSPLAERLLESLDKHGLEAFVQQQTAVLGSRQKGTKGRDYHNYNPNNNTVNMLLERNVQRRRGWTLSFEELMMEEILHAVSSEKIPEPIKHGVTIEDTSKNVDHFLRNREKYTVKYDEVWKQDIGFTEEWFTIADAYKQVLKQFETGKFSDGTVIDKTAKHHMSYRLSNMAEFIVGITQDKDIQKVLSEIKVPKSEKSFLTKLLDAIKGIWNFDDSVMDSLLAVTSDAAERVIHREKTQMEKVGGGIYRERAKQFFGGLPETKFQPTEQRRVNYSSNDERVKYLMSVVDNVPHYKRAFDSGQLSIDAYKPEEFKDFDVLSHAPDTASTVEQKDFTAQGGVGYPLLFPEEGWAAVSRGLEKRLNAIGEKNFEKHGKWIAPMALVLSHAQKMQGARNGTEGFLNIIKRLEGRNVITNDTLKAALIHGLKSIGTDINDNAQIGDAMFATYRMLENSTSSGFKQRAKFVSNVAGSIARNTGNLSKKQINALKEVIPNYTGNKTITKKELIPTIFQMFADPLVQGLDAPDKKTGGDVYAFVLFDKPLVESPSSPHGSYKYSVRHEDNSPVRVDLLSRPMKTFEMFKEKRTSTGVSELKEKTITNDTGQRNFPYGRVIHAQPSEGFSTFKSERTSTGVLLKNAAGYVISNVGSKFKVYNPYKAVIGIYDSEEQAKKRIYKEEPKR